ncbi:putative riboflavin biosynthesis protein Rib7 [Daldinia caldariorum]|uniref:putative riboflavin biosynthesis protein Rib7 n=1 Tax=Daldinia caldariorum TaxID=326644 RepID=UPI0020072D42|nr:putative riboflavin biosynthesis protein Rib7 [Daldinia caldariorum]KAI1470738.1 putative riboflavin biosynthesis protein Rib7 [Daldinia caldariorum]
MAENTLVLPSIAAMQLEPHLPPSSSPSASSDKDISSSSESPFVTLTFATSLDSALSLGPGMRTTLSGLKSKAMTHYLRSRHDAICVGVGTVIADDPGLNCRLAADAPPLETSPTADTAGVGALLGLASVSTKQSVIDETNAAITARQPRPIVIDPKLRWDFTSESKVMKLARSGKGLAPYIITAIPNPPEEKMKLLQDLGGKFIILTQPQNSVPGVDPTNRRFDWHTILAAVRNEGLQSIMIEGGGEVINSLLSQENSHLVDSVIITIAPTWLGQGSVFVSPPRSVDANGSPRAVARLTNITYMPLGEDLVLCGNIASRD